MSHSKSKENQIKKKLIKNTIIREVFKNIKTWLNKVNKILKVPGPLKPKYKLLVIFFF